jgi:hypothetical protein
MNNINNDRKNKDSILKEDIRRSLTHERPKPKNPPPPERGKTSQPEQNSNQTGKTGNNP